VLDFSGCKGAFMLPSEFHAKKIAEYQQEDNIAEPSLVEEKHQSEEAQDPEKIEDKKLENHEVVQSPYSPNVINLDNKKILIRSDQTESTIGKIVVLDDSAPLRMINPKNAEVEVWKVNEKNNQTPRPKPIVSM
jgi:hypothetical protein